MRIIVFGIFVFISEQSLKAGGGRRSFIVIVKMDRGWEMSFREAKAGGEAHTNRIASADLVAILLCTRDGGRFLPEQLDSIADQTHASWRIHASDDGSGDSTRAILSAYRDRFGQERLDVRSGPQKGFAANFLSLAGTRDIAASYFAFCDQDDVWEPDKVSRALAWLSQVDPAVPALYCSRTRLIDEHGNPIGLSPLHAKPARFGNAIVQSIAGGNTMVFNGAARRLLFEGRREVAVPSHDWWLYILVTAVGGLVRYDAWPSVRYRLHGRNAVGSNGSLRGRMTRLRLLLNGRLRAWTDMHIAALMPYWHEMPLENRELLSGFIAARDGGFARWAWQSHVRDVYRQTLAGNIALYLALALGKA
jgi:glycosyltransferase involved in cell wall biosynthesis